MEKAKCRIASRMSSQRMEHAPWGHKSKGQIRKKGTTWAHQAGHQPECHASHHGLRTAEKDQGAHNDKQNPAPQNNTHRQQGARMRKKNKKKWMQGKKKIWCNNCKSWDYHSDACFKFETNKQHCLPCYKDRNNPDGAKQRG